MMLAPSEMSDECTTSSVKTPGGLRPGGMRCEPAEAWVFAASCPRVHRIPLLPPALKLRRTKESEFDSRLRVSLKQASQVPIVIALRTCNCPQLVAGLVRSRPSDIRCGRCRGLFRVPLDVFPDQSPVEPANTCSFPRAWNSDTLKASPHPGDATPLASRTNHQPTPLVSATSERRQPPASAAARRGLLRVSEVSVAVTREMRVHVPPEHRGAWRCPAAQGVTASTGSRIPGSRFGDWCRGDSRPRHGQSAVVRWCRRSKRIRARHRTSRSAKRPQRNRRRVAG